MLHHLLKAREAGPELLKKKPLLGLDVTISAKKKRGVI
jgi:hypothetical protein